MTEATILGSMNMSHHGMATAAPLGQTRNGFSVLMAALLVGVALGAAAAGPGAPKEVRAVVEIEEDVHSCSAPGNGAGPTWAYGSTCIARVGDAVFISGLEIIPEVKPLNNVRWVLFSRRGEGWQASAKGEGISGEVPRDGRFHVTGDGRLYVFYNVGGSGADGQSVAENRIVQIHPDGGQSDPKPVALTRPFTQFYTATWRAGCAPGDFLDIYGARAGGGDAYSYARIRIE